MPAFFDMIDAAFAETAYPGDDELTVYEKGGRDYDETWRLLRGLRWQDMPVIEFISGDTPIPDLTPKALHYYLPALLRASLMEELAGYVLPSLGFYLNPNARQCGDPSWDEPRRADYVRLRSLLTDRQILCMQAVFEEWLVRGDVNEAEYLQLLAGYAVHNTEP